MNMVPMLLALCVSLVRSSPLPKLTTAEDPPCFLNDTGNSFVKETLEQALEKVNTRINVLKYHVESHIQIMKVHYCIYVSDEENETKSFINYNKTTSDYNDDQHNVCTNTNRFFGVMGNFYDMLNQQSGYFQQLRNTAIDETSLKRLIFIQGDIYDVMCSIKIAMKSKCQVLIASVPSQNLSDMFIQYRQGFISRCIQQTSEYIVMLDTQKVSKYLDTLFEP